MTARNIPQVQEAYNADSKNVQALKNDVKVTRVHRGLVSSQHHAHVLQQGFQGSHGLMPEAKTALSTDKHTIATLICKVFCFLCLPLTGANKSRSSSL